MIIIYPLGYALWASFHKIMFFGGYRTTFVGLENYTKALHSPLFWHSLKVSLRFTIESVILTLLVGLGIALVLSKLFQGRLKVIVYAIAVLPWAFSRYAVGIQFKYLWQARKGFLTALTYLFGRGTIVDTLGENTVIEALALGNTWNLAPIVAFFLLANMETVPSRLYDMAEIDHLGPFKRFLYVTLPYLRYTLFVFTIIITVLSLKVFDYIFVQTGGGPGICSATLTYQVYKESFVNLNLGYGAALSFLLLIIILAVTILLYVVWGRKEA
jgi:multiple sugar transport system permease protein